MDEETIATKEAQSTRKANERICMDGTLVVKCWVAEDTSRQISAATPTKNHRGQIVAERRFQGITRHGIVPLRESHVLNLSPTEDMRRVRRDSRVAVLLLSQSQR